jgi:hypothetical protein
MRFKEFLTERIIKGPTVNKVEVEAAIDFLNKHCKDGLEAIKNDSVLYRGEGRSITGAKGFALVDTSSLVRTSQSQLDNAYQIAMDASTQLSNFPSRNRCLICSSSERTAMNYSTWTGGNRNIYAVIPVDGTKIAVSKESDFIHQHVKSPLYKMNNVTDFGNDLVEIVATILGRDVDKKKFSKLTINAFNGIFAKADIDVLSLMLSCFFSKKDTFKIAKKNEIEREERELLETFAFRLLILSKKDKAFIKDALENEWIIPSSNFYAMKES